MSRARGKLGRVARARSVEVGVQHGHRPDARERRCGGARPGSESGCGPGRRLGATRSSAWKTVTASPANVSASSSSSIRRGVAAAERERERARSAIAAAAASAISSAARAAARSASSRTSIASPGRPLSSASPRGRRTAFASPRALCSRSRRGHGKRSGRVERRAQDRRRHPLLDRGDRCPAALAGVRDAPGEVVQAGRLLQRGCGEVEQPRADHAPAPPDLRHLGDVDFVAIVLGVVERRGLGVGFPRMGAGVGVAEDVEALRVGSHEPVFDPVVDHLHEMARAARTAVQVTVLGGGGSPLRPGVRAAASTPGASDAKIGSSRPTASSGPPIIRQ